MAFNFGLSKKKKTLVVKIYFLKSQYARTYIIKFEYVPIPALILQI